MKSKLYIFGLLAMALSFYACSDNGVSGEEEPGEEVSPFVGTWTLDPTAASLAVGPAPGDYSWWQISADDVNTRSCLYDDTYVFNEDGSFENNLGNQTWLETWQGVEAEGCGAPVAPHDGTNAGTWVDENGSLIITGNGLYLGLAKVHNTGENGDPANDTIEYEYAFSNNNSTLEITISGFNADVPEATWYFRFAKQ